jgi:Ca-activated chloride channel family protein
MTTSHPSCKSFFIAAALVLGFVFQFALAQEPKDSQEPAVKLSVIVTDKAGRTVTDLRQEDFLVSDDGAPQKVSFFSKEEVPISYGLIVDTTGSMRSAFSTVVKSAAAIINSNKAGDEAFLVRLVDGEAKEMTDWTSDKQALLNALATIKSAQGRTSILDAAYVSAERFTSGKHNTPVGPRRRALVLLSDGLDKDSKHTMPEVLKRLRAEKIQVLAISFYQEPKGAGIFTNNIRFEEGRLFHTLTSETEGRLYSPKTAAEVQGVASDILNYYRLQYVMGYSPASNNPKRKARVKLVDGPGRNKYSVITQILKP